MEVDVVRDETYRWAIGAMRSECGCADSERRQLTGMHGLRAPSEDARATRELDELGEAERAHLGSQRVGIRVGVRVSP